MRGNNESSRTFSQSTINPFIKCGVFILSSQVYRSFFHYICTLKSLIKIEAPKQVLGEKVIITLPEGKKVYTYENLIIEEEGKLFYKGESNTLNLTGGQIVYENWE